MQLNNIIKSITPALVVMIVGLGGAYLTYNMFFSNKVATPEFSAVEPAAGDAVATGTDVPAAVTATEGAADAAVKTETTTEAVAPECMKDEAGQPIMKEDGSGCVPMVVETPATETKTEAAPATETTTETKGEAVTEEKAPAE